MSNDTKLTCDGHELRNLTIAGLQWLESNYQHVNELNVFPVPDGDTGTNMLMTMQSAQKDVQKSDSPHAGKVAKLIANGAMMGSRGNSGTIMSQLWQGFAKIVKDKETFDAHDLAQGLREATEMAYRGVQRPVEGTILTVAREITEHIEAIIDKEKDMVVLLENMVEAGWESVERTPELLPTLKNAGVVDSGGTGLVYIIEGMLRYLRGEEVVLETASEPTAIAELDAMHDGPQIEHPGDNFYDVQFIIKGNNLQTDVIKGAIEEMGESAVVIGTEEAIKVHVHVRNPGIPINYGANIGPISDVVVENMLEQYEEYLASRGGNEPTELKLDLVKIQPDEVAVIAVAAGRGMAKVFQDLGVAGIVSGGQTNNPSIEELLNAIRDLDTNKVILLPNNKNIILSAEQVVKLAKEEDIDVRVIPTRTFPQGVSALFPYLKTSDIDDLEEEMTESKDEIKTLEVTRAVRTVEIDGVDVKEGQVIGLIDGKLKASGETLADVVVELMDMADVEDYEIVTFYYGDGTNQISTEQLIERLEPMYEDLEFEIVYGGQNHYPYVISIE